jgi:hypothetical protein
LDRPAQASSFERYYGADASVPYILTFWGIAEIRTVTTLRSKKAEIVASIAHYEKRIAQARADLSHVNTCIALFEVSGEPSAVTAYVDTHRLFARGELMT